MNDEKDAVITLEGEDGNSYPASSLTYLNLKTPSMPCFCPWTKIVWWLYVLFKGITRQSSRQ